MKYFKLITVLIITSVISFSACNDNSNAVREEAKESLEVANSPTLPNAAVQNPAVPEPKLNAEGVWHYTCSQGCIGGGGQGENCAVCGGPLAHNAAYHANDNVAPTNTTMPSATTPTVVDPAQNAAGIWHYTCGNGCAGGAGTAGSCGTCGSALAHNAAYH